MQDSGSRSLVDRRDGVLWLTLNRPDHGDAIASETVPVPTSVFRDALADPGVRGVVVGGAAKHFCSGGDVAGFACDLDRSAVERQTKFRAPLDRVAALVEAITAFDRSIIAELHDAVPGAGLMLALCADRVIGDHSGLSLFSHQRVGLQPSVNTPQDTPAVPRRVSNFCSPLGEPKVF